jgi:hypothetical protein
MVDFSRVAVQLDHMKVERGQFIFHPISDHVDFLKPNMVDTYAYI